jgi:hypothetical protein
MFEDYVAAVMADYGKKEESGVLSINFTAPTAAKIKAECISVCNERFTTGDERVLRPFFESREDADAYIRTIRLCSADKVKTLSNYLKGVTAKTDDKNIELLAWLIDFEHRPYSIWQKNEKIKSNEIKQEEVKPGEKIPEKVKITAAKVPILVLPEPIDIKEPVRKMVSGKLAYIAALLIVAALSSGGYLYLRKANGQTAVHGFVVVPGGHGCMYWNGDRYLPLPCNKKMGDTLVVALDTARLAHFQKIMAPDTITQKSIRNVWYFKSDNQLEYFTANGVHPVHVERKLKPLTMHMFEKYLAKK